MPECPNPYRGHRFPREVIAHAVRLSLCFALSVRDVEARLAERGVQGSDETVRRWVEQFGAPSAQALRTREAHRGRTWHMDEMAVRIGGQLQWRWRAVDAHGQTRDGLLPEQRDTAAAERCVRRPLAVPRGAPPAQVTTSRHASQQNARLGTHPDA